MKFFSGLGPLSKGLEDHRHQSYVRYAPDILLLTLILKQASGLKSMRRIDEEMNDDNVIHNIGAILYNFTLDFGKFWL